MEKKFFSTREGELTMVFFAVMIAFFVILAGIKNGNDKVCAAGFGVIMIAALYSPIKMFIFKIKK